MWAWKARAEYADGTVVDKSFPYNENDNYNKEEERRAELEGWLISHHEGCIWYDVALVDEE